MKNVSLHFRQFLNKSFQNDRSAFSNTLFFIKNLILVVTWLEGSQKLRFLPLVKRILEMLLIRNNFMVVFWWLISIFEKTKFVKFEIDCSSFTSWKCRINEKFLHLFEVHKITINLEKIFELNFCVTYFDFHYRFRSTLWRLFKKQNSIPFRVRGKYIKQHFYPLARKMPKIKFFEGLVSMNIQ